MRAATIVGVGITTVACLVGGAHAAEIRPGLRVEATTPDEVAHWSARIDSGGAGATLLALTRSLPDPDLAGVKSLRYEERIDGVPVFGAELVRHVDDTGTTRSILGRISGGGDVDTRPTLGVDQAMRVVESDLGPGGFVAGDPSLVVLPLGSKLELAYMMWGRAGEGITLIRYFVSAHSGEILFRYDDLKTATNTVGIGTGVWGDRKKVAVREDGGTFRAEDRLRPAPFTTYDMNFDLNSYYYGNWAPYVARDSDNDWTDGAVVDAHTYSAWTYDYYYRRFGREGINGRNLPVRSFVHVVDNFANAFWDSSTASMTYGDGGYDGGTFYRPFSAALDVVAHELTHGVTEYSWNGIYFNESGALNEAISDIMGASVEFFFQPVGDGRNRADWWMGEDLSEVWAPARNSIRSMSNPTIFGDPDHYGVRYLGSADNGGVHINSGIANQAFYLLVEGGTNRVSRMHVDGLGAANRAAAERIFYRGFTSYLTPSATFGDARRATIRAAVDLFGAGSNEAIQTERAWTAVGVQ